VWRRLEPCFDGGKEAWTKPYMTRVYITGDLLAGEIRASRLTAPRRGLWRVLGWHDALVRLATHLAAADLEKRATKPESEQS
jgi:hypothetical protein